MSLLTRSISSAQRVVCTHPPASFARSYVSQSAAAHTIAIAGASLPALWTAHHLSRKFANNRIEVMIVGREAMRERPAGKFNPGWIQPQSGLLGNIDLAPSLQQQAALIAINRYARHMWEQFKRENQESKSPVSIHLKGAWRIYDCPEHFERAKKSHAALAQFNYGGEFVEDPTALAERLPSFKALILEGGKRGIFFPNDGLVDSYQLRETLLAQLKASSRVVFREDAEVQSLSVNHRHVCEGVVLNDGEELKADVTILATGLANERLLGAQGVDLPLRSVSRAALAAIEGAASKTAASVADSYLEPSTQAGVDFLGNRIEGDSGLGTPDDLPIIGVHIPSIRGAIVINPTSYLEFTQSPALGEIAATHALNMLSLSRLKILPLNLHNYRVDRFAEESRRG